MAAPPDGSSSAVDAAMHAMNRSNSLASVASGQSASSLTRKPRARSRPRALTFNAPRDREKGAAAPAASDVLMLTAAEVLDANAMPMLDAPRTAGLVPDRPPKSPLRTSSSPLTASPVEIAPQPSLALSDEFEQESGRRSARTEADLERRRRKRGSSVPRDAHRLSLMSSASSPTSSLFPHQHFVHMQTVPNFSSLREARQRLRDSYLTTLSGTTTSVYPLSTSTESGTESPPSPRSLADSYRDLTIKHVSADDKDEPGFDPDDVSYRLRLLLNNSYFLPPAHSKPSAAQLAPASLGPKKTQPKGFFEMFRPRSKSKPESPVSPAAPQTPPPVLRTTSDTSTTGCQRTAPTQPFVASSNTSCARPQASRIAVVRETLDDLAAAAKQAEREIKALEAQEQAENKPTSGDVIDPTDALDLPPLSENSLFAVQASTLAGLGVEHSVGAAVLAERLPPGTPGVWSVDPDDSWRKALLHEAVSLSLSSTPPQSRHNVRQLSDVSSSTNKTPANQSNDTSISFDTLSTPSRPSGLKIDHRIVMPGRLEDLAETGVQIPTAHQRPRLRTHSSVPDTRARIVLPLTVPTSGHPLRSDSPNTPHTPLPPPPRKSHSIQAARSVLSDVESSRSPSPVPSSSSFGVRKTSSSPQMHDRYALAPSMTSTRRLSPLSEPVLTKQASKTSLDMSESDEGLEDSHSIAPSNVTSTAGASLAEASALDFHRPSPTRSAFHDARESYDLSRLSLTEDAEEIASEIVPERLLASELAPPLPLARIRQAETLSPPPRTSSSLAHTPLRPPPRSSSFNKAQAVASSSRLRDTSPRPSVSSSDPGHSAFVSAIDLRDPSPRRPTTSRSEQSRSPYLPRPSTSSQQSHSRHRRGHADVTLQVPGAMISHALQDAPATPIEFFDQVEAASRGKSWEDDDDGVASSSTDDYGSVWATPARFTPSPNPSPRSSPRQSPRGTPAILSNATSSVTNSQPSLKRSPAPPVSNMPPRVEYFKAALKDARTSEVLEPLRTRPATAPSGQARDDASIHSNESGESVVSTGRVGRTPSMLRLDGMLVRHMEAEREVFQRIAQASKAPSVHSAAT